METQETSRVWWKTGLVNIFQLTLFFGFIALYHFYGDIINIVIWCLVVIVLVGFILGLLFAGGPSSVPHAHKELRFPTIDQE